MAKIPDFEQNQQSHQRTQQAPQMPQREPQDRNVFMIGWILVPLCILGMLYVLSHIQPVLKWDAVMDFLNVHNRERYTMIGVLCLVLICIVAVVRIIGRKDGHED